MTLVYGRAVMAAAQGRPRGAAAKRVAHRPGVVGSAVLAGLVADAITLAWQATSGPGHAGIVLVLVPGIVAMAACGLVGTQFPGPAALAGAVVLYGNTVVLNAFGVIQYTTVFGNASWAQTATGIGLVYLSIARCEPIVGFLGTAALVVSGVLTIYGAGVRSDQVTDHARMALAGGTLVAVVALGAWARWHSQRSLTWLGTLLKGQWPLVVGLVGVQTVELLRLSSVGPSAAPLMLASVLAAVCAGGAPRYAAGGALVCAGSILLAGCSTAIQAKPIWPGLAGGVSLTQVVAATAIIVFLVRDHPPRQAVRHIAILAAAIAVASVLGYDAEQRGDVNGTQAMQAVWTSFLFVLGLVIGLWLRSRAAEQAGRVAAAVRTAQTAERLALARELHDLVAHHVTGIVVQAQAAKLVAGQEPTVATDALERIETSGNEALVAMRRLVASMRDQSGPERDTVVEHATTDLPADLQRLVETAEVGANVSLELRLSTDVPPEVARSALRLVQESLTNTAKHIPNTAAVAVLAETTDGDLHVAVRDDGGPPESKVHKLPGGYGLVGMRERVELLGGLFHAGRDADGGWQVEAWLPLRKDEQP